MTQIFKTFEEWLAYYYYEGFDVSGLTDEEYYELEDLYAEYKEAVK